MLFSSWFVPQHRVNSERTSDKPLHQCAEKRHFTRLQALFRVRTLIAGQAVGKEGQGSVIGEDSILERVTVAAEERHLSHNSLIAYRRTWLKIIAWAAAQGLVLETFPVERVGEFYEEATRGRSASHHLQVKAALALLYHVLGSPNPFAQCHAPKFAPEKTELRYHTSSQLGQLLRELREDKGSYFGHLTYHLASALFFTGCRYHEWDAFADSVAAFRDRCTSAGRTRTCRSPPTGGRTPKVDELFRGYCRERQRHALQNAQRRDGSECRAPGPRPSGISEAVYRRESSLLCRE